MISQIRVRVDAEIKPISLCRVEKNLAKNGQVNAVVIIALVFGYAKQTDNDREKNDTSPQNHGVFSKSFQNFMQSIHTGIVS